MGAPWTFDDKPSLGGLSTVFDVDSAISYLGSGISSALGRPIALASFLINTADWPNHPESFRHVNVLLHILNGMLVALLSLQILKTQPGGLKHTAWPAVALAALWMLHPFLASTSLMVVQRMTILAASFTLLGLLGFVHGRRIVNLRPIAGYLWMSCSMVFGALLGLLAKENAALLPFFAAALNYTVLAHLPAGNVAKWRIWQVVFFVGPVFLLIGYIVTNWSAMIESYAFRPFTLTERLLTEPIVLWDYVRQLLLPNVASMGPFQDDTPISRNFSWKAVASITAWIIVVGVGITTRRRIPWLSFAIFWFTIGHLLESSIFNLELYFEHRNYVPSLGPLAAVVALAWRSSSKGYKAFLFAPIFVFGLLLWQVTSLWGADLLAGERWSNVHPSSSRAAQHLAQRYLVRGDINSARAVIHRASLQNPRAADLAIQNLQLQCGLIPRNEFQELYLSALDNLERFYASYAVVDSTDKLLLLIETGECPDLSKTDLIVLLTGLLKNKQFEGNHQLKHHIHHQLAELFRIQGDLNKTVIHLNKAFSAWPNPGTAELIAAIFASAGLYQDAIESLDDALEKAPHTIFRGNLWKSRLNKFKNALTPYAKAH